MFKASSIITKAMNDLGIQRIVTVATVGIFKEIRGIAGIFINFMLRHALRDHRAGYQVIAASNLDWTVVRPMGLVDTLASGKYRVVVEGAPTNGRTISRSDVAEFLVKVLEQGLYIQKSPAIAD
jgi:hypothetical protein